MGELVFSVVINRKLIMPKVAKFFDDRNFYHYMYELYVHSQLRTVSNAVVSPRIRLVRLGTGLSGSIWLYLARRGRY